MYKICASSKQHRPEKDRTDRKQITDVTLSVLFEQSHASSMCLAVLLAIQTNDGAGDCGIVIIEMMFRRNGVLFEWPDAANA